MSFDAKRRLLYVEYPKESAAYESEFKKLQAEVGDLQAEVERLRQLCREHMHRRWEAEIHAETLRLMRGDNVSVK